MPKRKYKNFIQFHFDSRTILYHIVPYCTIFTILYHTVPYCTTLPICNGFRNNSHGHLISEPPFGATDIYSRTPLGATDIYSRTPLILPLVIRTGLALRVNLSINLKKNTFPRNYQLSDQVQYSVMFCRTSDRAWSKGLDSGAYCRQ